MKEKEVKYKDEKMEVKIPDQGKEVEVKIKPVKLEEEMYKDLKFKPLRVVTNFEVNDKKEGKLLKKFDPPFEFQLRYTKEDFEQANETGRPMRMAYWLNGRWNIFTVAKHGFELRPDPESPNTGFGYAQISDWDDPNVSWGT